MTDGADESKNGSDDVSQEMERMLATREKIETEFRDKFTKVITVMFTDLKGSTALADKQGDIVSRMLVKKYMDIIMPAIKEHNGVFIKSIGDGTLSYFENAQDALRAAAKLQREIDAYIMEHRPKTPILARAGLHTGRCIIEKNDIFGDVVNTASRFEGAADPGGIAMSEDTLNALTDRTEFLCKYVKTATLKGKETPFKIYKAFWNPDEAAAERLKPAPEAAATIARQKVSTSRKFIIMAVITAVVLALFLGGTKLKTLFKTPTEKRSVQDSVGSPDRR